MAETRDLHNSDASRSAATPKPEGSAYDVLVFSAHPDDAEMVMGGTMIKLAQAGYTVLHVCLSRGEKGTYGDPETRSRELQDAAQILGCEVLQFDLPDLGIENNTENRLRIARLVREVRPQIVFSLYHTNPLGELGGIANIDHYSAGSLVRDGLKLARLTKAVPDLPPHTVQKLYFYMLPRNVFPTVFVDVSSVIDQTVLAVRAHRSQLSIRCLGVEIEARVHVLRSANGHFLGVPFAEGFVTDMALEFKADTFFQV